MAAEAVGGRPGARRCRRPVALEMVHTYSLIHDDLPAMDDDDLRRGRPTCHRAFDEATAILAGDALLTLAFEVVARDVRPAEAAARCCRELAEAAGPLGHGRRPDGRPRRPRAATDAHRRGARGDPPPQDRRAAPGRAADGGPWPPGPSERSWRALDAYGRGVGLAFQIVDDLLDVQGDEAKLGKRVGKDSGLGKWTYPASSGSTAAAAGPARSPRRPWRHWSRWATAGDRLRALALELLERDR